MPKPSGTRSQQRGAILIGLAGGMLVIAGGLVGAYYVVGTKSVAAAETKPAEPFGQSPQPAPSGKIDVASVLARGVELKTATGTTKLTWAELGAEPNPDEGGAGSIDALAAKGSLPVRIDRDKAVKALLVLKAKTDKNPVDAYLDVEERKIHDDTPGIGLDVYGSLPKLELAARSAAPKAELATILVPAQVTKAGLGIDDISNVMGHYQTQFSVYDRDRNFNLKLAASKLNGVVLKPGQEWSFNDQVGERSQKNGYKIAHVINAGEMVDGLAGGTCQISTTLFGAAFFAGIDIVKTTNHSRPSAYTALGFDATVVWPNTDLKLKNPYDFPVAIHYVVANGEAKVEILGKPRPYDKIQFVRQILEEKPYESEERPDDEVAEDETSIDQEGFPGYRMLRERRFIKDGKVVKTNKWSVEYAPVTEYIRRGTNKSPDAKHAVQKDIHKLPKPGSTSSSMEQ
jgi:vancomycin resistance protein YoaR